MWFLAVGNTEVKFVAKLHMCPEVLGKVETGAKFSPLVSSLEQSQPAYV